MVDYNQPSSQIQLSPIIMNYQIFHGPIKPIDIANALSGRFNRGNLRVQTFGNEDRLVIQISSRDSPRSGGTTAMTVVVQKTQDGIGVQVSEQNWLGIAASLGQSALWTWVNPLNIISRLDDIAQDIENLQLEDKTWETIKEAARNAHATQELSSRFGRVVCNYCLTANPIGTGSCIACGAPLGPVQPSTCPKCGFVVRKDEITCPNCGQKLSQPAIR